VPCSSVSLDLGFRVQVRVRVRVRVSLVSLVSGSSLVGVCRHLATVMPQYYGHDGRVRY